MATTATIEKPEIVTDQHLEYLDELRASGETNMMGAAPYLENEFDISIRDAQQILRYWMQSFGERHPK